MDKQQTQHDPHIPMSKGQSLLDGGEPNLAMAYFFLAGEEFIEVENWEKAGDCFSKAAYCYELDGRYEEAARDYEHAAENYANGHLANKTSEAKNAAEIMRNRANTIEEVNNVMSGKALVIGVVGLNGSGKDEVVKRLHEKFGIPTISTGDITREIATEEGIEPTRSNLNKISQRYWAQYGREFYPRRIAEKINENGWQVAAVTGIRPPSDVRILRDFYGENFVLVHVEVTDPKVRFKRLVKRSETRDPKEFEEFMEQEAREAKVFQLQETISMASFTIKNDGSLEDLYTATDRFALEVGIPLDK